MITQQRSSPGAGASAAAILAVALGSLPWSPTQAAAGPRGVQARDAWIALPPTGAPTAGAYLTLKNEGETADRLLSASTSAGESLELHSMSMAGGVMRMRPAPEGLAIGPGSTVVLGPGGDYHLMLIRPKRPLQVGDQVPATLRFTRAGSVKILFKVEVRSPAP